MRDIERGGRGPAMDMGDPRTPMAWQHRDSNYREDEPSDSDSGTYKVKNQVIIEV